MLTASEAQELIRLDPDHSSVIIPLLNGRDLNQHPNQQSDRFCVCFWDWSETQAQRFGEIFSVLTERVKPVRQEKKEDGSFKQRHPLPENYCRNILRETSNNSIFLIPAIRCPLFHKDSSWPILRCPWHGWEFDVDSGRSLA